MSFFRSFDLEGIPKTVVQFFRWRVFKSRNSSQPKHIAELRFWEGWVEKNGPSPESEYYKKFMMDMGGIKDDAFFDNRSVWISDVVPWDR